MPKVIAVGGRQFVRQLELGGTNGMLADEDNIVEILEKILATPFPGLVLLDANLITSLPEASYNKAFYSKQPEVVALGGHWNDVLRQQVKKIIGADLLAPHSGAADAAAAAARTRKN